MSLNFDGFKCGGVLDISCSEGSKVIFNNVQVGSTRIGGDGTDVKEGDTHLERMVCTGNTRMQGNIIMVEGGSTEVTNLKNKGVFVNNSSTTMNGLENGGLLSNFNELTINHTTDSSFHDFGVIVNHPESTCVSNSAVVVQPGHTWETDHHEHPLVYTNLGDENEVITSAPVCCVHLAESRCASHEQGLSANLRKFYACATCDAFSLCLPCAMTLGVRNVAHSDALEVF